jgi:hypothetical protein
MNYSDLNKTQKRVIDAFITLRPELANTSTITRPEVEELFFKLKDARDSGGDKIGYPMWLVKGANVGRGQYVFPAPNVTNDSVIAAVAKRAVEKTKAEVEFLDELRAAGIEA